MGITVTGSGESGDPYIITPPPETVFGAGTIDDSIDIIAGGTYGHAPLFGVRIDPSGTNTPTLSASGLRFDCCGGGSVNYSTALVNTDYTVVYATDYTLMIDSSGGHVQITLPAGASNGDEIVLVDQSGTFDVDVDTTGAPTINGAATYSFNTAFESITLRFFMGDWYII